MAGEVRRFSLRRKSIPIELEWDQVIDGKETVVVKKFILKEMDGAARDRWQDLTVQRLKIVNGQPAGVTSMAGLEDELISAHLFREDGVQIPANEIAEWPSATREQVVKLCKELSGLDKEDNALERAKNASRESEGSGTSSLSGNTALSRNARPIPLPTNSLNG